MIKFNYYIGAAASAWLLAILVISAELYAPFKNMLTSTFSHHWIGKSSLIVFAFVVFGFLMKNKLSIGNISDDKLAWYSVLGSLLVILLFFTIEFFK